MKDWINLVERAANGDANIRHAAEILHAHMVHGRAQDWQYEKLLTLLPRPTQGATLYRAEPMLVEDIERLDQGEMMRDLAIHFNEEEVLVLERDRVMNRQNTVVLKDSMTNRIKAMLGMGSTAVNV
ncbi:MAG: hypothetical protein EOO77_19740 [Oxalobacteraceae bacterium]|nr:MAG: hypothetical protein EOO77_19740 [Oxalobacteraceae bacterium]